MTTLQEALRRAHTGAGVPGAGSHKPRPESPCTVCLVLEHTEDEDLRAALKAALGGILSGRAVHRAFREAGLAVGRDSIIRHKNEGH